MLSAVQKNLVEVLTPVLIYVGPIVLAWVMFRWLRVKPAVRMIWVSGIWLCLAVLGSFIPVIADTWKWVLGFWLMIALADLLFLLFARSLEVGRKLPGRMAMGVESEVELTIKNDTNIPYWVQLYDGVPDCSICEDLPWVGKLPARGFHKMMYRVTMPERGEAVFGKSFIELRTGLQLWSRQFTIGEEEGVKVYPNYEPVVQLSLMSMESQAQPMGIVEKNRAGLSKDFHQLRDYQYGDNLSQIDWKSSSKRLSLISRDYQELRDQTVILAVDCGKRMRSVDGGVAQFDHCLNAMLLLAYVALRQGDSVGIMSFGSDERWLPPMKGTQSMTAILNHLYDYQTTVNPSDYSEAAEQLLARQARRSLVIMMTNVRGEDGVELIGPLKMMRKRHVVLLASLREKAIIDRMEEPVEMMNDALAVSTAQRYMDDRREILEELNSYDISSVDTSAQELPVALANQYLLARKSL